MSPSATKTARVGLILGALLALYVAGRFLGLDAYFHADRVRALVHDAGAWGELAFVGLFVGAVVAQVPGLVFVMAAPALFPLGEAWALSFFASMVAVVLNFELVRRIGGQPLAEPERPWLQRLIAGLDEHPVRTVAVVRLITIMFPPVTGALALTKLSAKDHAIGSAIGMLLPVTALLLAGAWLLG